jgi:outer membrane murein-binding lipoprotein Lpp
MTPQWIITTITTLGAIVAAYFVFRGSVSQSKPGAQQVINQGFADLVREQKEQLSALAGRVATTEAEAQTAKDAARRAMQRAEMGEERIGKLETYERRTSGWHRRHLPFDEGAKQILETVAPDELGKLPKLEPFPVWRDDDV